MESSNFAPGFYSQDRELQYDNLKITGEFPDWVSGALLRTGPALYELEHQNYNHWYDGLAMLYKFSFDHGQVSFACKYLKSKSYKKARKSGEVKIKEWATDPCRNIFEQVKSYFLAPALTDNGNINIIKYDDELLATSETPLPIEFDRETLETIGHAKFKDKLQGQIDPAHPHYDEEGNVYSYLLKYSLFSKYQVYKMPAGTKKREKITEIKVRHPAYMHSFAKTENYIVLAEFPFVVSPLEMKFGDKPLIESYKWHPDRGTRYKVINLKTGEVTKYHSDPFFAFHHVNAFEKDDQIHMDLVAFQDPSVIGSLYLEDLRSNDHTYAAGRLTRITIPLTGSGNVEVKRVSDKLVELPSINYQDMNTKEYRYMYGAGNTQKGNWLDDITKIDVKTGEHQKWYKENCYPGEPVFVSRPHSQSEDDGLLLSVVLDADNKHSFLLALDAKDLSEVARASLPEILPFSFHGNFFK